MPSKKGLEQALTWLKSKMAEKDTLDAINAEVCYNVICDLQEKRKVIGALYHQSNEARKRAKERLDEMEYEAASGGGMVSVKVTGKREISSITIDPQVVDPDDVEMLQDLIIAAVNEALRKGEEAREAAMSRMAPGLSGMGGLF